MCVWRGDDRLLKGEEGRWRSEKGDWGLRESYGGVEKRGWWGALRVSVWRQKV